MATVVPIELIRLRSATATYVAILYDTLPALEALVEDEPDAGPVARFRDTLEAALDAADAPGTPAAILTTLGHLLGTAPPTAGAPGRPRRPSFASMMQVHLGDGIADDEDDERDDMWWTDGDG
ncbi:MAG: hypothetical protein E6J41_26560 [Chloroflexi bacterium]|nr:MAG: hypothetical protein E6J41_26560 [Chloroflexota bacterium]